MIELRNKGLYNRYKVEKTDGTPIDSKAKYFVLRYDKDGSDPEHVKACQRGLLEYARAIASHLPVLAGDILHELAKNRIP